MAVNSRIDFYVTIDWCINVGNKLDDVKYFGDIREVGAKGFSFLIVRIDDEMAEY